MNSKVRRYQPVYLSPQSSRSSLQLTRKITRPWKELLNQEVSEYYSIIKNKNNRDHLQPLTTPNSKTAQNGLANSASKSEVRSFQTSTSMDTPYKQSNLQVSKYDSILTSVIDPQTKKQKQRDNYRIKLLEQECRYLRTEFINHCQLKHRKDFGI